MGCLVHDFWHFLPIELLERQAIATMGTQREQLERRAQQARTPLTETLATRRNDVGSKRMSSNDGVHRSATAGVTSSEHARLWVIALSALLLAVGFARRRSGDASPVTGDRRSVELGRDRPAERPSQVPARGWK